jgi:hypothetical protein
MDEQSGVIKTLPSPMIRKRSPRSGAGAGAAAARYKLINIKHTTWKYSNILVYQFIKYLVD